MVFLSNVELDVPKQTVLRPASEFALRYNCSAVVVPPELITNACIARAMARSRHKVIAAIDCPKGNQFMADKFRGVPSESLNCDGFEIMLTPTGNVDIKREVKFLSQFLRDHFPPSVEIRFVLGYYTPGHTQEQNENMLRAMSLVPAPAMVRTTCLTKIPNVEGTPAAQKDLIDQIFKICHVPLKLSGNVDLEILDACRDAKKFGCTIEQAQIIAKDQAKKESDQAQAQASPPPASLSLSLGTSVIPAPTSQEAK